MKLIESEVIIKEQEPGIDGIYKQIEWAGRYCYKSHDKITEDGAKQFVDRMINSRHLAMCEHGTVYLKFENLSTNPPTEQQRMEYVAIKEFYETNPYSKVVEDFTGFFVTTNLRVLVEHELLSHLNYLCEPTDKHEKRITARFTCDMGVGREITRHRTMSFAQESTRYCNYSKNKFDNELTFIIPTWVNIPEGNYIDWNGDWCDVEKMTILKHIENDDVDQLLHLYRYAEQSYKILINKGALAQEARQVLPLGLKTEIVVTGFESDWKHFFDLRADGKTGAPHPDIKKLAVELREKLNSVNK